MDLEVKRKSKTIYHAGIAPILPPMLASVESGKWLWLPSCHSACWKPCLPALLGGWHSVLVRVFCLKMRGFLASVSPYHSETFLIAFFIWESKGSLYKMRKQPVNWVIAKASLVKYCHRGGEPAERKENGAIWGSSKFLKIILFSNCLNIISVCALARAHFLSGNLRPSSEHFWRVRECKSWSNSLTCWQWGNNDWT